MFINNLCPSCTTYLHYADAAMGMCPCCGYDESEDGPLEFDAYDSYEDLFGHLDNDDDDQEYIIPVHPSDVEQYTGISVTGVSQEFARRVAALKKARELYEGGDQ